MFSCRPPSGLHRSRHEYWGNPYGGDDVDCPNDYILAADSAVDEEHGNRENGGDFKNGNNNDNCGNGDDSSADRLAHTQFDDQAPSSPFNTVADIGLITNPFVRTGQSLLDPSDEDEDKQAPHSQRI
jgi:hypothetical protein